MKKHQIKQAFTLVELVVVIVILAILGTIAFIALSGYSTQARDSTRISDLSSMKTGLELYNLDSGKYPLPTDYTLITYSGGVIVWKQGTFGTTVDVNVDKLDKIPLDPLVERQYTYSLTDKGNEYQLGGIMEGTEITFNTPFDKGGIIQQSNAGEVVANAYVTGNYNGMLTKVINGEECDILSVPSIITNNINVTDLQEIVDMNLFVYRGYKNLPSSYRGSKFNEYGGFPFAPNKLIAYSDTGNCETLSDRTDNTSKIQLIKGLQDSYLGTVLQNEGDIKNISDLNINLNNPSPSVLNTAINTVNNKLGGNIVPEIQADPVLPGCTTQPTYTNATFTAGTATQLSQQWQSTDSNAACYWTCGIGKVLQGTDCLSSTASGTAPNGTSEISNATSLVGGTWNYNIIPGIATYTCNTGYTRGGSTCNINTYTVSGSMGASAGGATLNIGGTNVIADGSGNFSTTINYGTSISNITITKPGYTCSVTTNGPGSLTGNITNIAGNCIINTYSVTGSFGANGNGVTVNVCGTNVVANSVGGFIATVNYGSTCNNITATRAGYSCTTTTNGPSSLSANVSNIAGSCTTTSYTVSGSFGAGASLATLNVCGSSVSADASGNFSTTRNYGSNCSNITATKSGYSCTTSTNGPASLTANTTNIAGSCTVLASGCTTGVSQITLSNGQTWSCMNLGATTVRDGVTQPTYCGTLVAPFHGGPPCNTGLTWLGSYYQWGRNDTGWTLGWNPADNAWGNTTNTSLARQGPCPTGWHVPSTPEWQSACNNIYGTTCTYGMANGALIASKLKLPYTGGNTFGGNANGYYAESTRGGYWSSTPSNDITFYSSAIYIPMPSTSSWGLTLRCLKN